MGNTLRLSATGEKIPCQITAEGNGKYSVSLVTGLNPGEEREYVFVDEDLKCDSIAATDGTKTVLKNSKIRIEIPSEGTELFSVGGEGCKALGVAGLSAAIKRKTVEVIENGAVLARVKITAELEKGGSYELEIRLAREQELAVLDETIGVNGEEMHITWQSFEPEYRVSAGLPGTKYANEYLYAEDEVPAVLVPHDVTNGTVDTSYIAFYDSDTTVGAFMGDCTRWDDGAFAIQTNNRTNAVHFYVHETEKNQFVWKYPLNNGTRQTCIAIYESEKRLKPKMGSHIRELLFWNYYLPLDMYKDWIFEYDDSAEKYPKYFRREDFDFDLEYMRPGEFYNEYSSEYKKEGLPEADALVPMICACRIIREPWSYGPVWSRVFGELIPIFDLRADEMKREDFVRYRNICILFAYISMNENNFPTRHNFAGHTNFMLDYISIVGLAAAMFPTHPDAGKWKSYYHRAVLLTMKLYVRPDVKAWSARGGRSAENLGCYSWAGLRHVLSTGEMMSCSLDENPALHKNFVKWADWFLNSMSAPINGRRAFPPLGAHAGGHILNPYYPTFWFRLMGNMLKNYAPLTAEQIFRVCPSEPLVQLEAWKNDLWSYMNKKSDWGNTGITPDLKSAKYTGYGCLLRSHVNEDKEMCVFLQQIDEGPNYRWGSSCSGGCGNIYYYADNKRYSDNRKEDVGDDVMADADVSCTFAVLQDHTYKSVGKNELTYPLSDFGFCQYARVNAGSYSDEEYKYRSVLMADNDYIAIYDAVKRCRTQGRFSWFSNVEDEMPQIYQLKPGLEAREVRPPQIAVNGAEYNHVSNDVDIKVDTRGVMFDGRGDFFTVVSHRKDLEVQSREYGAVIKKDGCTDYVFDLPHSIKATEDAVFFDGRVGFVRVYGSSEYDMAIIDGNAIGALGTRLEAEPCSEHFSMSLSKRNGRMFGKCEGKARVRIFDKELSGYRLYINSEPVSFGGSELELDSCTWELTASEPAPSEISGIRYCENPNGVRISWQAKACGEYIVKVGAEEYTVPVPYLDLQLDKGKYIITVCGKNGEMTGKESSEYPMYITKSVPNRVEGLLVSRHSEFFEISWGEQLGIKQYTLWRSCGDGEAEPIYSGEACEYRDEAVGFEYKYFVTAENDIGKGEPSLTKDTVQGGMADYDPIPEVEFIRDTINNEHGFAGFDYKYNENRRILKYPN